MTDIRWRGIDHQQLYDWINSGEGPRASTPQLQYWGGLKESIADIHGTLTDRLAKLGVEWQGAAGDSAQAGVNPLQQWADDVQGNIESMSRVAQNQADLVSSARAAMPEPVPMQTPQPTAWATAQAAAAAQSGNPGPAAAIAQQAADFEAQETAAAEAQERAIQVMGIYESNSEANRGSLAMFEEPPPVGVEISGPAGVTGSVGYQSGGGVFSGGSAGSASGGPISEGGQPGAPAQPGVPAGGAPGQGGGMARTGRPVFTGGEPVTAESGELRVPGEVVGGAIAGGIGVGVTVGGRGSSRRGRYGTDEDRSSDPLQGPTDGLEQGQRGADVSQQAGAVHYGGTVQGADPSQVHGGAAAAGSHSGAQLGPTGSETIASQTEQPQLPQPGQQTGAVAADLSRQQAQLSQASYGQSPAGQPQIAPGAQAGVAGAGQQPGVFGPGQPAQPGVMPSAAPTGGAGMAGGQDLVRGQSPLMRGAAGGYQGGFSGQGTLGTFGGNTHASSASGSYDATSGTSEGGYRSSEIASTAVSGAAAVPPGEGHEQRYDQPIPGEPSFEAASFSERVSDGAESFWGDDRTVAPPVLGDDSDS